MNEKGKGVLKGLRVIELCDYIAGPGAAGIFADWGADVIKVERPGGDAMRHAFDDLKDSYPFNPMFEMDNRGKRAAVIDISNRQGCDALIRLIRSADVFLTNVRQISLTKAGLDSAALCGTNPRLVYALVTGYGLTGPDAHKAAFDVTAFWGRAGVGRMTAPKGVEPFMVRTGVGDHVTSLATVSAILAALFERSHSGKGRFVQTSLLTAGTYAIGSDLSVQLRFGKIASNRSRKEAFDPLANLYQSGDGVWFILNPRIKPTEWPLLAKAAGRPDFLEDERFRTGLLRRANTRVLVEELEGAFAALTFEQIAKRLDDADLAWAPAQTAAEVASDPQAHAAGAYVEVEDGRGGRFLSPAAPARFPGADIDLRPPVPSVGQHTREVLEQAGFSPFEIDALFLVGAVA